MVNQLILETVGINTTEPEFMVGSFSGDGAGAGDGVGFILHAAAI